MAWAGIIASSMTCTGLGAGFGRRTPRGNNLLKGAIQRSRFRLPQLHAPCHERPAHDVSPHPDRRTIPLELFLAATAQTLESGDGLLIRPPRQGGFEVVIGLWKSPGHEIRRQMAACTDRHDVLQ